MKMSYKSICRLVTNLWDSQMLHISHDLIILYIYAKYGHLGDIPKGYKNHPFFQQYYVLWNKLKNMPSKERTLYFQQINAKIHKAGVYLSNKASESK